MVPKGKPRRVGEVVCSMTESARLARRKTCAVECESAVEQYQEMRVRYYE
jgi:hypothetical protein